MSKPLTIIIVTNTSGRRCFSNFKKACEKMGLSYHYLKRLKLPIEHKGLTIERVAIE